MGGTAKGRAEKRPVVRAHSKRSLAVVGPRSSVPTAKLGPSSAQFLHSLTGDPGPAPITMPRLTVPPSAIPHIRR